MNTPVSPITDPTFALVALRGESDWEVQQLPDLALESLDELTQQLRAYRNEGPTLGLISIDDDWSAIIRPVPGGVDMLISDTAVALDDDLAAEIVHHLHADIPTAAEVDQSEEPFPEGKFTILADLGISEDQLSVLFDDPTLFATEQLETIAEDLGFGIQFTNLVQVDED